MRNSKSTQKKPSGEAFVRYIIAKGKALHVQSYLAHGRQFERFTESELSEKYVEGMRDYASDPFNKYRRLVAYDILAEYELRGLEPSPGLVAAEVEAIVKAAHTAYEQMSDERKAELEAQMQDEYASAMQRQH